MNRPDKPSCFTGCTDMPVCSKVMSFAIQPIVSCMHVNAVVNKDNEWDKSPAFNGPSKLVANRYTYVAH